MVILFGSKLGINFNNMQERLDKHPFFNVKLTPFKEPFTLNHSLSAVCWNPEFSIRFEI